MSRSIGDTVGTYVGVISKPYIKKLTPLTFNDNAIILASDGIWDAMNNDEVVNYVEKFRKVSFKGAKDPNSEFAINASNCNIAHLLCEQARTQWL